MRYVVRRCAARPAGAAAWDDPAWQAAATLEIAHFRPEGSGHRPQTFCRLLYDDEGISGIFLVRDRYVRCVNTTYQSPVYQDSCVEIFLQPSERGYFNFEFNCSGAMLAGYVMDPERVPGGFRNAVRLTAEQGARIMVSPSLSQGILQEIEDPVDWTLGFFIPFSVIGEHSKVPAPGPGNVWKGNFFKCADASSRPHWGSWSAVDEKNFHLPRCFGAIQFG